MINIKWLFLISLSVLFCCIGLIYAIKGKRNKHLIMMFCSFVFMSFVFLEEIGVILDCYQWERELFESQTASIFFSLKIYLLTMLSGNLISLFLSLKKSSQ